MLIVAGGYHVDPLASTEVFDYSLGTGGSWREAGPLPSPRTGVRGASLQGVLHVSGGYDDNDDNEFLDEIVAWDPVTETWAVVGQMQEARHYHGVTPVDLQTVAQFCTDV